MAAEQFDQGAFLSRARPVLTFATTVGPAPLDEQPPGDATPPPMTCAEAPRRKRSELPVIPRIVRRTYIDDDLLRPIARAARTARGSTAGTLATMGLVLVALGTFAGLNMRSLASSPSAASASFAGVSDAVATERTLARAQLAPRVERITMTTPRAEPAEAPRPAHPALHSPPPAATPAHAPGRPAFAGAGATRRGARHPSSAALAHR
ncbi:MAG TPA: hypothetical protein VIF15_17335 [Polyangiaceae bacterium]|jgi:hypothetical protein